MLKYSIAVNMLLYIQLCKNAEALYSCLDVIGLEISVA